MKKFYSQKVLCDEIYIPPEEYEIQQHGKPKWDKLNSINTIIHLVIKQTEEVRTQSPWEVTLFIT